MLEIRNLKAKLVETDKFILNDINLNINKGEVHYITGRNGSGKSSLLKTIMGHSSLEVTEGSIQYLVDDKVRNLLEMSLEERSQAGIFLANQHPIEVPGVPLRQFLRIIYNLRLPENEKLPIFKFKQILHEICEKIDYPVALLDRNLNEGMSGGEKKKTEILQMFMVKPKLVLLDEVDSGLDKESIKSTFSGINNYLVDNPEVSAIIVSHYEAIKDLIKPDFEHNISEGVIVN